MLRKLKVWWLLLTNVGSAMGAGRQADRYFRYYVIKVLADEGLFDYLKEPRTYGQILAKFGFVDCDYTRELLEILATDKRNLLITDGNLYRLNPDRPLPRLDKIVGGTKRDLHGFLLLAEGMTSNLLPRLRRQPVELSDSFEQEGRQLLTRFDKLLGARLYYAMRKAAIGFLTREDRAWLRGKTLLEVGCGSGRETAELWLKLGAEVRITAVDSVSGMLQLAKQNFDVLLKEVDPAHPPVTDANRPVFRQASATRLPFDDDSFDAACWFYLLHWTPDPRQAISEVLRVVKPGGLLFGGQAFKPEANPYFDMVVRINENCHGFFWREDYQRWFAEHGLEIEMASPAGIFRVRNQPRQQLAS
jgi:ubiquinone/menaquinone biosynthesis C-methylase UbiE